MSTPSLFGGTMSLPHVVESLPEESSEYSDDVAVGDESSPQDEPEAQEPVAYSSGFTLRPHQKKAVTSSRHAFSPKNPDRIKRGLIVHPTGTGKTGIMAELARLANDAGRDCLWTIPAGPPVDELAEDGIEAMGRIGRIAIREQANWDGMPLYQHNLEEGVGQTIVASAPTLRGGRLDRWVQTLRKPLILIDEAHFSRTKTIEHLVFEAFPKSYVVGLTATPDRADGKSLGTIYDGLIDEYKLVDAINDVRIVQPLWCPIQPDPPIDLSKIRITLDGDFDDDELEKVIIENMERLVAEAKPAILGRKTLAFTPNIYSAYSLAEALKQVGIKAAYIASKDIDGKPMSREKRKDIIRAFEEGIYDVICNPILLSTGFDCPMVDCILNMRPTKSRSRYAQICGRAMRLYRDKDHCLIVDFACDGHDLASVADLFDDSSRSKQVVERAKQIMKEKGEQNPQRALELAEAEETLRLERVIRIQEREPTTARRIYDPVQTMAMLGLNPHAHAKEGEWFAFKPAEDRDKAFLNKMFNKKRQNIDVDKLSYYAAKQMKKKVLDRMKKGLCSYNQIALLVSKGMHLEQASNVMFSEVNDVLKQLEAR